VGGARLGCVSTARPARTAEVIAVGSELLGTTRLDTNSLFIAERLSSLGIVLQAKMVVGDDRNAIAGHCTAALSRADVVIITGGLGPTDDDLTREAAAQATGLALEEHPDIVERIEARFTRRGMRMPEVNRRQAQVIRGATVLANPNGTAPGQWLEHDGGVLILLPGPPREMQPMLTALCEGPLRERASGERIYRTSLYITGRTESHVEEAVQPIYSRWRGAELPIETTILATPGQIELHLAMRSGDEGLARYALRSAERALTDALGRYVFSIGNGPMEEVVGKLLRERRLTISAAESCTGGLMMARLTEVPGSSAYVLGGVVSYSDDVKRDVLGVPPEALRAHGAVSEPVAGAMAEGIKAKTGSDIGVSITGIAGPDGGSAHKPVGTVVVAAIDRSGPAVVRTYQFVGGRALVRFQASQAALEMVRRLLLFGDIAPL
jgi:nicotinamide-nucleotide amidase